MKTLSLVALAVMIVALVGLVVRHELLSLSPFAILFQCAAFSLMVWARLVFGPRSMHGGANPTQGGLVTRGPYRFIRHPIYTAACLFGLVGVVTHPSMVTILLGSALLAGALMRIHAEERVLREYYPEYKEYARSTKRMIPGLF